MAADLVPPEKRPQLITTILAALGFFLVIQLLLDWWSARMARKIAQHLREKEV
jgi:Kef-type K+ transport system membrane component KefB